MISNVLVGATVDGSPAPVGMTDPIFNPDTGNNLIWAGVWLAGTGTTVTNATVLHTLKGGTGISLQGPDEMLSSCHIGATADGTPGTINGSGVTINSAAHNGTLVNVWVTNFGEDGVVVFTGTPRVRLENVTVGFAASGSPMVTRGGNGLLLNGNDTAVHNLVVGNTGRSAIWLQGPRATFVGLRVGFHPHDSSPAPVNDAGMYILPTAENCSLQGAVLGNTGQPYFGAIRLFAPNAAFDDVFIGLDRDLTPGPVGYGIRTSQDASFVLSNAVLGHCTQTPLYCAGEGVVRIRDTFVGVAPNGSAIPVMDTPIWLRGAGSSVHSTVVGNSNNHGIYLAGAGIEVSDTFIGVTESGAAAPIGTSTRGGVGVYSFHNRRQIGRASSVMEAFHNRRQIGYGIRFP